jgi:hypothetical protein
MHFPSSHIAHATLGYISLDVKKDSRATFEKKKERKKWEERGREKDKCHTRREGPTYLKEINLGMNNGHVSEGE